MIKKPFIRDPYNYDVDKASDDYGLCCKDSPSMTQQHMASECDIHSIINKYVKTGQAPIARKAPTYGDFSGPSELHSVLNGLRIFKERFFALTPEMRARFNNDPTLFADFISNPNNASAVAELIQQNQSLESSISVPVGTKSTDSNTPSESA